MSAHDSPTVAAAPAGRAPRLAVAGLLVGATGIGFAPIFVGLSETGPAATAFWRVLIALPLLAAWAALPAGRRAAEGRRIGPAWLILPGVFFAADLGMWHWALQFTSAANATVLTNLAPVLVSLVGWVWLTERIGPVFVVGLIVAVGGACALMAASLSFGAGSLLGDGLGLLTAVSYAGYQLSVKHVRRRYGPAVVMTCAGVVASLLLLPAAWIAGERLVPISATGWAMLVALALVCHIAGQGAIAWALGHLPVSFSSVTLLWQPVVAAVLAWPILHQPVGALQAAGGLLVLAGIYLARRGARS